MAIQTQRWQFTVADFSRMAQAGIFADDDRVELIEGEVRPMSPIGTRHAAIVKRLIAYLARNIPDRLILGVQDPIELSDYTQPQPDISVVLARDDFYAGAHPGPAEVLLVIEVADTSIEYDRDEKVPLYARTRIAEVWLVNVETETVTQYDQPDGTRYRGERTLGPGEVIVSSNVGALQVPVDVVFG